MNWMGWLETDATIGALRRSGTHGVHPVSNVVTAAFLAGCAPESATLEGASMFEDSLVGIACRSGFIEQAMDDAGVDQLAGRGGGCSDGAAFAASGGDAVSAGGA